jgi:hypothetical protein
MNRTPITMAMLGMMHILAAEERHDETLGDFIREFDIG